MYRKKNLKAEVSFMKEYIQNMVIGLTAAQRCVKIVITDNQMLHFASHAGSGQQNYTGGPTIAAIMELSIQISSTASLATQASKFWKFDLLPRCVSKFQSTKPCSTVNASNSGCMVYIQQLCDEITHTCNNLNFYSNNFWKI